MEDITGEVVNYDPQAHYISVVERLASNPQVDVDKLQKIMDMQEHSLDREAEKSFNADMVLAQSEIKMAVKNKQNQQTRSSYADLAAVIGSAKPVYTKHGFALSFYEGETKKDKHIRVMCDVMHRDGHTKTRFYDVPLDVSGIAGKTNKTLVHGGGSSTSYGRRYLTCMVFNIPTGDDDDGNIAGGVEYVAGENLEQIKALIAETESDTAAFLKVAGAESIDAIPVRNHTKVMSMLNRKKANMRQPGSDG